MTDDDRKIYIKILNELLQKGHFEIDSGDISHFSCIVPKTCEACPSYKRCDELRDIRGKDFYSFSKAEGKVIDAFKEKYPEHFI